MKRIKNYNHTSHTDLNQIHAYFKRFIWFTLISFAIVFSIILFLAYAEISSQSERNETAIQSALYEKAEYIDNLLGSLGKSVEILAHEVDNYYRTETDNRVAFQSLQYQFLEQTDSATYSMNHAPDSLRNYISALTGAGTLSDRLREKSFIRELGLQFHIGGFLSAIMAKHPDITWIYAISRNHFVNYFPFSTTDEVQYSKDFHSYDIYQYGTPDRNPSRKLYITPAYQDAVGKGLMISIGKPYYEKDTFRGILAVDVTLSFLSNYLQRTAGEGKALLLFNEHEQILAQAGFKNDSSELSLLKGILDSDTEKKITTKRKFKTADQNFHIIELEHVPWKLAYAQPTTSFSISQINTVYIFVLMVLLTLVSLLIYFSFKTFIYPARKLVEFIDHQSRNIESSVSAHPAWQNWFNIIQESFDKNRDTIRLLDREVKRKTAELVEANAELQKQKASLEEMNKLKDKIFSIVSHDLRSPIHSLVSILSILRKGFISNDQFSDFINQLEANTRQAKFMLENILQWSLSNLKSESVNVSAVNLKDTLTEHFEMLGSIADLKHIRLRTTTSENVLLQTDKGVLDLVLRNLLNNALKFSHKNSEVCVSYNKKGGITKVRIDDYGKGMSEKIQARIFVAGQGIQQGTLNENGTGLGLSLCKEFLEKIGGKIWFESQENKGTSFMFTIPDQSNTLN